MKRHQRMTSNLQDEKTKQYYRASTPRVHVDLVRGVLYTPTSIVVGGTVAVLAEILLRSP